MDTDRKLQAGDTIYHTPRPRRVYIDMTGQEVVAMPPQRRHRTHLHLVYEIDHRTVYCYDDDTPTDRYADVAIWIDDVPVVVLDGILYTGCTRHTPRQADKLIATIGKALGWEIDQ